MFYWNNPIYIYIYIYIYILCRYYASEKITPTKKVSEYLDFMSKACYAKWLVLYKRYCGLPLKNQVFR